ncbi:MAG: PHP domain-containing protein [Candidatus Aminicenantaceae bacterium]
MSGCVDLHIHSHKSSDGDVSVHRLLRMAREADLAAIAITDHDTTAAYPEAIRLGKEEGVEVIPSIELTTLYEGREFHLLLPFVDWDSPLLESLIETLRERRHLEARARVARLRELGFDLTWEEVQAESAPFAPLGVTIAQVVLRKAAESGDPAFDRYFQADKAQLAPYAFYRDYFMEGRPAFVPRRNVNLLEVLEEAPAMKGVPVLAHPGAAFQQVTREDLHALKAKGLQGLEVYTSYHDEEQARMYLALAGEFDLVATTGSDFHGSIKPHIPFGSLREGQYTMVEELEGRRP